MDVRVSQVWAPLLPCLLALIAAPAIGVGEEAIRCCALLSPRGPSPAALEDGDKTPNEDGGTCCWRCCAAVSWILRLSASRSRRSSSMSRPSSLDSRCHCAHGMTGQRLEKPSIQSTCIYTRARPTPYIKLRLVLFRLMLDGGQLALGLVPRDAHALGVLDHLRLLVTNRLLTTRRREIW